MQLTLEDAARMRAALESKILDDKDCLFYADRTYTLTSSSHIPIDNMPTGRDLAFIQAHSASSKRSLVGDETPMARHLALLRTAEQEAKVKSSVAELEHDQAECHNTGYAHSSQELAHSAQRVAQSVPAQVLNTVHPHHVRNAVDTLFEHAEEGSFHHNNEGKNEEDDEEQVHKKQRLGAAQNVLELAAAEPIVQHSAANKAVRGTTVQSSAAAIASFKEPISVEKSQICIAYKAGFDALFTKNLKDFLHLAGMSNRHITSVPAFAHNLSKHVSLYKNRTRLVDIFHYDKVRGVCTLRTPNDCPTWQECVPTNLEEELKGDNINVSAFSRLIIPPQQQQQQQQQHAGTGGRSGVTSVLPRVKLEDGGQQQSSSSFLTSYSSAAPPTTVTKTGIEVVDLSNDQEFPVEVLTNPELMALANERLRLKLEFADRLKQQKRRNDEVKSLFCLLVVISSF